MPHDPWGEPPELSAPEWPNSLLCPWAAPQHQSRTLERHRELESVGSLFQVLSLFQPPPYPSGDPYTHPLVMPCALTPLSAPRSAKCTLGMVLPLWSDTQVFLDGDG